VYECVNFLVVDCCICGWLFVCDCQ